MALSHSQCIIVFAIVIGIQCILVVVFCFYSLNESNEFLRYANSISQNFKKSLLQDAESRLQWFEFLLEDNTWQTYEKIDNIDDEKYSEGYKPIIDAKSNVRMSNKDWVSIDGCNFTGPKIRRSVARSKIFQSLKFYMPNYDWLLRIGYTYYPQIVSVEYYNLCSYFPRLFLPSVPLFSEPNLQKLDVPNVKHKRALVASALEFKDVCITFNMDSMKQAQRGVLVVDRTNNESERCVPCPNPQMNNDWGSNKCGMMWFHQINVKSLKEYNDCYVNNYARIKQLGQRQLPGETYYNKTDNIIDAVLYYDRPTLLLQFVRRNPGHQLWDSLFSIVPILMSQELFGKSYFEYVISHQEPECKSNTWICEILRSLGVIKLIENQEIENVLPVQPNILTCFESLIVPIQGWNRDNKFTEDRMLRFLMRRLAEPFGLVTAPIPIKEMEFCREKLFKQKLGPDVAPCRILLYGHLTKGEAGKRRSWLNIHKVAEELHSLRNAKVSHVEDFAALTIQEQAQEFNEAQVLIMPHGGQFGNSIFLRENTIVIELTCSGYSHLALRGHFAVSRKIVHIVYSPCSCKDGSDSENFSFSIDDIQSIFFLVEVMSVQYGSHHKTCSDLQTPVVQRNIKNIEL